MSKSTGAAAPRPLSPHLQVWRWHVTMAASILHRISGCALVAGVLLTVAFLVALAAGPQVYTAYLSFAASPIGLLIWFGFSAAAFVHLFGGLRHLIWDRGVGFDLKMANFLSYLSFALAAVATLALWAWLFIKGAISL